MHLGKEELILFHFFLLGYALKDLRKPVTKIENILNSHRTIFWQGYCQDKKKNPDSLSSQEYLLALGRAAQFIHLEISRLSSEEYRSTLTPSTIINAYQEGKKGIESARQNFLYPS